MLISSLRCSEHKLRKGKGNNIDDYCCKKKGKNMNQRFLIKKDRTSSTSESALWYSNSTSMADASIRRESTELLKGLVWIIFLFPSLSLLQAWFTLLKLFVWLRALKHKVGFTVSHQLKLKSQEVKKRGETKQTNQTKTPQSPKTNKTQ